MTDFDIQKTARAVVDMLLSDERFIKRVEKMSPRRGSRMLNSAQAAIQLGISKDTIRNIAPYIGGIKKGADVRSKWTFEEDTLKERYIQYLNSIR